MVRLKGKMYVYMDGKNLVRTANAAVEIIANYFFRALSPTLIRRP